MKLLYQWKSEILRRFPNLNVCQGIVLALYSYGVVQARCCRASIVAEELGAIGKASSVERRLRRWLSNKSINVQISCGWWIRWVLGQLDGGRPMVLIDESKLGARMGVMMVSLGYEGRAIPLIWCCYKANSHASYPSGGQVKLITTLLEQIVAHLPAGCPAPLVEVDRGIGHSSDLQKALRQMGLLYLFRVPKNSTLTLCNGKKHQLQQLIGHGQCWSGKGTLYAKQGTTMPDTIVHLIWKQGYKEPWCLVTNDPSVKGTAYAWRMWQEEGFRDLKSGGWQWQCSLIEDPARAERLILVLAVAYAWVVTQGTLVLYADRALQREIFDGLTPKYSVFRLGLRFFKRMMQRQPQHIWPGLYFAPRQLLC